MLILENKDLITNLDLHYKKLYIRMKDTKLVEGRK